MQEYVEGTEKKLIKIVCNACGRNMKIDHGIVAEGVCAVDCKWGYFSRKDGVRHQFDLCEDCYDSFIKGFVIPVKEIEERELL